MITRRRRHPLTRPAGIVLAVLSLVLSALTALPASAATAIAQVNFAPATYTTPAGYTADSGQPYTAARGYGWIDLADSNPLDMTANTRSGANLVGTAVSDIMMQPTSTPAGRWQYAIANGTYNVTLTVGDSRYATATTYCCLNSVDRLTVNGVEIINDFVPSAAQPTFTSSANVSVTNGLLVVDPTGGVNTKLDHVEINAGTGTPPPPTPLVTGVTPLQGATQVALNTGVSLAVSTPILLSSVSASTIKLTGPSGVVAGNYNTDAAGGTASFTPSANLAVNSVYTLTVSGLLAANGQVFAPFTSSFTTGTAPPPLAATAFTRTAVTAVPKPTVLKIGPDGELYVGTQGGAIYRFTRGADGTLSNPESISPFGDRVITGLAFDPVDPTKLWVTNNYAGYTDAPPMSGHISTVIIQAGQPLSADTASAQDVIVGLPRSMHDHMTNGLAFGPDGKLYIAQGANTSYGGAPDPYWGSRGEAPLTADILTADVDNAAVFPSGTLLDVNTDPPGFTEATGSDEPVGYDPTAPGAPLTVYAYGTRNPFTLMWDSNGSLYAPVNESAAGGLTPTAPNNIPPSIANIQAYTDYFTRIIKGKYYGHPNATQGYYALNGGNPTAAGDPYEVTEYPVGTQPDPNWQAPDFAMGVHRSPDGAAEYTNATAFGGALKGKILVSEYSDGDDIVAVTLDGNGKPVSEASLPDAANPGQALIFNNPLGLATDKATGVVYVAESLDESTSTAGEITLLTPSTTATPPPVNNGVHVNFQPASVTAPAGYAADTGAPFNGQSGWQDLTGNPIDLTANTRVRHSATSPDVRYDTQVLMQAPSGSGNTTPGRWATTLPNGQYDVSVTVGDPTAINSVDEIVAQPGTADATTIINQFVPTTAAPWSTITKRVNVSSGLLVLSPVGGTNTKLDFIDAVPATTDTMAPSVTLSLAGPQNGNTGPYLGSVTVTATATDNVGVTSETYSLDNGPATPYTVPVVVSSTGAHTITVTAKDAAGNPGTATSTFTISASTATALHVNFAAQTSAAVAGYVTDYGQAFSAATGSGWEAASDGTPLSFVGNGRERFSALSPDKRYDTLIQMQELASSTTGTHTPGQWEHVIGNGTYAVTVAVGDATATNSVDDITAEPGTPNSTVIINNFQATATTLFSTVTKTVTVSDGFLTLSAAGGTNTKIDYVDAVPVTSVDTTAPTVSVALAGSQDNTGLYTGDVKVTITAADEAGGSGLASTNYTLDGGSSTAYTVPFVVHAAGTHTLVVTATDNAGNHRSTTQTWTSQLGGDPTPPTVSIALTGNNAGAFYIGDVTATVTAAAGAGGSGLATTTYVLDGGAPTPYTTALVVHPAGNHTLVVTAADDAGNQTVATQSWTSQLVDTTPPTAALALGGILLSGTTYSGNVTATVTASDAGSGVGPITYVLDTAASAPYTAPVVVTTVGPHTMTVTVTDKQGNTTVVAKTWTQQTPDVTKPVASVALAGTTNASGVYTSDVKVTITAADEVGGSGLKSTTYSLDNATATAYTAPIVVSSSGSHSITVTATDFAGNVGTATAAWNEAQSGTGKLVVTSPDDAVLANASTPRLVFSAVRGLGATPARQFTFSNTGASTLSISNLAIAGTDAGSWKLDVGQATTFTILAGATAQVSLLFTPTDPTGCASTASPYAIGAVDRNATLTFSTSDPTQATGSALLSGVNSCYVGGNNEPVLDQLLPQLGYTDVVDGPGIDPRYIGPLRYLSGTDEIQSPYFTVANSALPVSVIPIAHYGSASNSAYQSTGYYAAGSTMAANSTCSSACKQLWQFPPDTITSTTTTYNQNQKLLPSVTGVTTFSPTGTFGLFSGDYTDVNFSDDALNTAHTTGNVNMPVPHYLHDMRVFPAYGPGHVAIPNTYIVGIDLSRVPSYKNNDFQDIVLLVRNVAPAVSQGPVIGAATSTDLTQGGSVSPTCAVTGFDGVLANTGGTQCNAANLAFSAAGLTLTSTAGQLANGNQQNALYKVFDGTRGAFTVDARIAGPVTQLTTDYQQTAAFFGPDQNNFIKVEAEHNGTGSPRVTMFYSEKGVSGTVASVALPAMTTATSLDLIIKGNTTAKDPLPYGDTYGVSGFPLDELTAYYSLNGGTPVQIGTTTEFPAAVTTWFSRQSKAGILTSNSGTTTPIAVTFSKFAVTSP